MIVSQFTYSDACVYVSFVIHTHDLHVSGNSEVNIY